MLLRLIAILFVSAGLMIGMVLGWHLTFASLLLAVNADWVPAIEAALPAPVMDVVVSPVLSMPAWIAAVGLGAIAFLAGLLMPGRG